MVVLLLIHPPGVDVEIPLRAAERWLDGRPIYPPEAFGAPAGPDLPYLYPPLVLPLIAPLLALPRVAVLLGGVVISAIAAWLAGRRLGLGPVPAALLAAWPPFFEGILGANVGIVLFALFVATLWPRREPRPADGVLSAAIATIKVSLSHTWVNVLARCPAAALLGLGVVAALALLTLPLVGTQSWFDWIGQAARSGDPAWPYIGAPASRFIGVPLAIGVTAATLVAAGLVRGPMAGAWIGVLTVIGAPSLHPFGLVFLLPALLVMRRELALLAATLLALPLLVPIWTGVGLAAGALALGRRHPWLLERPADA